VLDEQREARERLGAALARVLLQLGVRLQVRAKVGPVGERAPALRTRERPFSRMGPHVALQQPRPRKRLAAHGAAARQRVRPDVHLQRAERRVRLAAVTTRQLPACSDDDTAAAAAAGYCADTGRRLRGTSRCRRRSSVMIVTLSGRRVPVSGRIPLPVSFFR